MKKFWTKARLKASKANTRSCTVCETAGSDGLKDTFTPTSILQQITHSQIISFHCMYLSFANVWRVFYLHQLGGSLTKQASLSLFQTVRSQSPSSGSPLPLYCLSSAIPWNTSGRIHYPLTLKIFVPLNLVPHRQLWQVWMLTWDVCVLTSHGPHGQWLLCTPFV